MSILVKKLEIHIKLPEWQKQIASAFICNHGGIQSFLMNQIDFMPMFFINVWSVISEFSFACN